MKLLFFDTETTGKAKDINAPVENLSNWPRLVQLAWQVCDDNQNLIEEYDFIVKPSGFTIPLNASEIHKITNEKANLIGTDITIVLHRFHASVSSADLLIAHNFSFDYGVMGSEFLRNNLTNILSSKNHICTMKSSTDFCKINGPYGYKWPTLPELYLKLFNEIYIDHHNALEDSKATARCFWELNKIKKYIKIKEPDVFDLHSKFPIHVLNENINFDFIFHQTFIFFLLKKIYICDETNRLLHLILRDIKLRKIISKNYIFSSYQISYAGKIELLIFSIFIVRKVVHEVVYSDLFKDNKTISNELCLFLNSSIKIALTKMGNNNSDDYITKVIESRFSIYDQTYYNIIEEYDLNIAHNVDMYDYIHDLHNSHLYPHLYYLTFFAPLMDVIKENSRFGYLYFQDCDDVYKSEDVKKLFFVYPKLDDLEDLLDSLGLEKEDHWFLTLKNM